MRFRLRTLMIVVTFAGFVFGWVGYARRQATFHRQRVGAIAHKLAETTKIFNDTYAMHQIQSFAANRSVTTVTYHEASRWQRLHPGPYAVIKNGIRTRMK